MVRTALGGTLLSPDFIPGVLQHADTVLTYENQTAAGTANQIRKFRGDDFGDDARFGDESAFGKAAYQVSPIGVFFSHLHPSSNYYYM